MHTIIEEPLGANWGPVFCLKTLQDVDYRGRGSNQRPYSWKMTALAPEAIAKVESDCFEINTNDIAFCN